MTQESSLNGSLVISYLGLRKAVGIIGTALPFVLAFGKILVEGPGIQSSISSYYHTAMRDVFVGSLCAIAVFLMSYHGYERKDDIAGDLACVFALGVALFPTTPEVNATLRDKVVGALHLLFAGAKGSDTREPSIRVRSSASGVYRTRGETGPGVPAP